MIKILNKRQTVKKQIISPITLYLQNNYYHATKKYIT